VSILSISILISAAVIIAEISAPFPKHSGGFNGRIYGIVVMLEVIAIIIAAMLLNRPGRKQYLIPVVAFIVGAHFFGMVPALRSNEFWWIGGAMCALALLTMSILPRKFWAPVVGIGCAMILWFSALRAFF
jgi:predicted membrane channel-forming protein YqfA (hemolysin III family)